MRESIQRLPSEFRALCAKHNMRFTFLPFACLRASLRERKRDRRYGLSAGPLIRIRGLADFEHGARQEYVAKRVANPVGRFVPIVEQASQHFRWCPQEEIARQPSAETRGSVISLAARQNSRLLWPNLHYARNELLGPSQPKSELHPMVHLSLFYIRVGDVLVAQGKARRGAESLSGPWWGLR
jgi:hypothetical protein